MFMIWSRILKMTLIQQQSLNVRHTLSGSGLEGDLGERGNRDGQLSDTLTTMPLTRGLNPICLFLHGRGPQNDRCPNQRRERAGADCYRAAFADFESQKLRMARKVTVLLSAA